MRSTRQKVLFVTLKTFSLTGGVEKVSRGIGFALREFEKEERIEFRMISLYDEQYDEKYVLEKHFRGYRGKRINGMIGSIKEGLSSDIIILSHINLAPIGVAIKRLRPSIRVIVWTHGIEIWRPLNRIKRNFLKICDDIVAVSHFTAAEIERMHDTGGKKVRVVPNGLDPFFKVPNLTNDTAIWESQTAVGVLRKKHQIKNDTKVFLALTRLRGTEKSKNYDRVISLLGELKQEGLIAYYILCGKYDEFEYSRIMEISTKAGISQNIILPGFVSDEDLSTYYQMADAFVLPSTKEGFGLAFIEAQACGLQVLAGGVDGSREAIRSEQAGILIDPDNISELKTALLKLYSTDSNQAKRQSIQEQCLEHFSYQKYLQNLRQLLLQPRG